MYLKKRPLNAISKRIVNVLNREHPECVNKFIVCPLLSYIFIVDCHLHCLSQVGQTVFRYPGVDHRHDAGFNIKYQCCWTNKVLV